MKKILLVEPAYNASYAPLGLMKISTMHRYRGNEVLFVKGRKKDVGFIPDIIYITTLFTFWYKKTIETILFYKKYFKSSDIKVGGIFASLMPDFIEEHTGIKSHFGLLLEAEDCAPDYETIPSDCSISFTSRGCINKCKFCVVPKIEGNLHDLEDWSDDIDTSKQTITFWDNNWFAKDFDIVKRDIDKIRWFIDNGVKSFDFNQGLDARLFTDKIGNTLKGMPLKPIRFAFDNMSQDGHTQRAIGLARKLGFTRNKVWHGAYGSKCLVYVLYNFKDTPADFYYRIREVVKAGGTSFPMQYHPHDDLNRTYIGKHWTLPQRNNVCTLTFNMGLITTSTKKEFEYLWGRSAEEFVENISMSTVIFKRRLVDKRESFKMYQIKTKEGR